MKSEFNKNDFNKNDFNKEELIQKYLDNELSEHEVKYLNSLSANDEIFEIIKLEKGIEKIIRNLFNESAPQKINEKIMNKIYSMEKRVLFSKTPIYCVFGTLGLFFSGLLLFLSFNDATMKTDSDLNAIFGKLDFSFLTNSVSDISNVNSSVTLIFVVIVSALIYLIIDSHIRVTKKIKEL